ncbi:MAG: hypothetical protein KAT34_14895 [Candidatus Aminicenantes bacterium]|nr:hypothetical protein [Candidatus Aminicenantes bacterium]
MVSKIFDYFCEGFIDIFNRDLPHLNKIKSIYFVCTDELELDGRFFFFFKKDNGSIKFDKETYNIGKIWSLIFPEMRENFLVESVWASMIKKKRKKYPLDESLVIQLGGNNESFKIKKGKKYIWLSEKFFKKLNGDNLSNKIKEKYPNTNDNINEVLRTARQLRYNAEFNKNQIEGLDNTFDFWISDYEKNTYQWNLNGYFKDIIKNIDPPFKSPKHARRYLTIWQNFSIVFPDFSTCVLNFKIPSNDYSSKYTLGLFYDKLSFVEIDEVKKKIKNITTNLGFTFKERKRKKTPSPIRFEESAWDNAKDSKNNKKVIKELKLEDQDRLKELDNILRIAGGLAFSIHEGYPSKFAFLAGDEQTWPAIAETICFWYVDDEHAKFINTNLNLSVKLCEANYSLFKTDGVVGFYDIKHKLITKLIRLKYPSNEDLKIEGKSISDLDDLYCWTIENVFKKTKNSNVYIIYTLGDGKIGLYGMRRERKFKGVADLLFLWDLKTGIIRRPIEPNQFGIIEERLKIILNQSNPSEFNNITSKLRKIIRKISTNPGEGACLIFSNSDEVLEKYCAPMEFFQPTWLANLSLNDPLYSLKSAFVMDGANFITENKISSRLTVYPHYGATDNKDSVKAWSKINEIKRNSTMELSKKDRRAVLKLTGKGSKTHTSCNLSTLPSINKEELLIVSISADGPIQIWPDALNS